MSTILMKMTNSKKSFKNNLNSASKIKICVC